MLILFLVFQQFVWKPAPKPQSPETAAAQPAESASKAAVVADSTAKAVADTLYSQAGDVQQITLRNSLMQVSFSNQGARISQVSLNKFKVESGDAVNLIPEDGSIAAIKVLRPEADPLTAQGVYFHEVAPDSSSVTFWMGDKENPRVRKRYTLDTQYGINLDIMIRDLGTVHGVELDLAAGIADSESYTKYKNMDYKFVIDANNELKKVTLQSLRKKPMQGALNSFRWAALRSKYFALAVLQKDAVPMRNFETLVNEQTGNPAMILDSRHRDGKLTWEQSLLIYAGPADYDILASYGSQMENIAERGPGWLRWMGNIIAGFLKTLYSVIPNYGLVIIVFSLILSVILTFVQHPLTRRGMEANLKMQMLQPRIEEIKKRVTDLRAQQIEISKLYKETGTNPFGGCISFLPLLIQLPILISLYNVLRYTLDMRNAHFVLWLKDLSLPDSTMVLPILMGVTMIIQSRIMRPPTPPADQMTEQQIQAQKMGKTMNWVMPVMMFFIFRGMPAGLVLYYTVYSIFSTIQQYHLQKKIRNKGF